MSNKTLTPMIEGRNKECREFDWYATLIRALPERQQFEKADLLIPEFRVFQDGSLTSYYAPFNCVNAAASVVLVGITPSWAEMELAYRVARQGLHQGLDAATICHQVQQVASFIGPMRRNLTNMLDQLGLPAQLGIPSSTLLFGEQYKHLHVSAVIRYPTFVAGRNYTGHSPGILTTPIVRQWIDLELAAELQQVSQAVIIPLGKAVTAVLAYLIGQGAIERDRCVLGFPHPSGANGQRVREFTAQREWLTQQLTSCLGKNLQVIKGNNDESVPILEIRMPNALQATVACNSSAVSRFALCAHHYKQV